MGVRLDNAVPNSGDWSTQFTFDASSDGGKTYSTIDFTGCFIKAEVRDQNDCVKISATTDNGKITITSTGFDLLVPYSEMKCICPASYSFGLAYQKDDMTIPLYQGTLIVEDGNVRI